MRRLSLSFLVASIVSIVLTANNSFANDQSLPRRTIHIFQYYGIHEPVNKTIFRSFQDILHSKLVHLSAELRQGSTPITNIGDLKLEPIVSNSREQVSTNFSLNELNSYYSDLGSLAILHGRVRSHNGGYSVRSNAFLGDGQGTLDSPTINMDLPVLDDEFDMTRDSHSTVMLFALGIDALSHCSSRHEAVRLLSMAYENLHDLESAIPKARGLREAIDSAITKAKVNCLENL